MLHNILKKIILILNFFGFNPIVLVNNLRSIFWYFRDLIIVFSKLKNNKDFKITTLYPCLLDKYDSAGVITGHYFHLDLLISQKIFLKNPKNHIDVGSRIDGFVAHVASFRKINIIDIRDLKSELKNIEYIKLNICKPLDDNYYNITDSISCLHALEHFGLGRYGDPIDIDAHIKALNNFHKMLKKNGIFYFASPIGPQRIEFNAHRVFSIKYLIEKFANLFLIKDFYFVDDKGSLVHPAKMNQSNIDNNFGCNYGCGIFLLKKI